MLTLLVASNILFPLIFIVVSSVRKGAVEVNHEMIFSVGFLFYWIAPVLIGLGEFFQEDPTMNIWYSIFHRIEDEKFSTYFLLCLIFFGFFFLGNIVGKALSSKLPYQRETPPLNASVLSGFWIVALAFSVVLIVILRDEFFRGYRTEHEEIALELNWSARGTFAACNLFLLDLAILYAAWVHLGPGKNLAFSDLFLNKYSLAYGVVSLIFLSAGGRLYFVTGVMAFIIYRSVFYRSIGLKNFLLGLATAIVIIAAIGVFRIDDDITLETGNLNIWQEGINCAFPLVAFLRDNSSAELLTPFHFPMVLMGDFANLIPLVLFPDKADLLINPEDLGYSIYSPAGGLNSFVSCLINFGSYGTMAFLFLVGLGFQLLRSQKHSILARTSYVMASAALGATFFRDPFSISLVKAVFQFSFFVPCCIILAMRVIPSLRTESRYVA